MPSYSPFCFGGTISDIEALRLCPDDTSIVVWSMQQPAATEQLMNGGKLTGDPKFAFSTGPDGGAMPGRKAAYVWMQEQMSKRLPKYNQELPVWVMLTKPSHTTRENDKLLRLEIPKSRMLISFYQPWCELMPVMSQLENLSEWPHYWHLPSIPYVAVDADDVRQNAYLNGIGGARRGRWDEAMCRSSWERIFDLSLADRENFLWYDLTLQGVVPAVFSSDVKDVLPISMNPPW